jgi:hypothetical protein
MRGICFTWKIAAIEGISGYSSMRCPAMQMPDRTTHIAESAIQLIRFLMEILIVLAAILACRWGMRTFLFKGGEQSDRRRYAFLVVILCHSVFLVLRVPAERVLTAVGDSIGRVLPPSETWWPAATMVGLYYAVLTILIWFLAFFAVGLLYGFGDRRIDAWQSGFRASGTVESNPRFQASRIFLIGIQLFCIVLATALVVVYFLFGFEIFPRTRILTQGVLKFFRPPVQDVSNAFERYVPNLGYLFIILMFGWVSP